MKFTAIFLLAACVSLSARTTAQTISLNEKGASLKKVMALIEQQTGYQFFYKQQLLENLPTVTVSYKGEKLESVLDNLFRELPIDYTIVRKSIVLKTKVIQRTESKTQTEVSTPVVSVPPPITVRGRVVDENGEGIVASILIKGTNRGTNTDDNGYFSIDNVDENATLVITGVSIQAQEIKVNGRASITVTVKITAAEGEDVTIKAGYYNVKKREATGSISRVDAKTIEKQPVLNPLQAIQGRVPGVNIQQLTGAPGGGFNIQIRGRNSLRSGGNDPLYIIDGVPFPSESIDGKLAGTLQNNVNPLNAINPNDIESIEILRDADATAIYGSRGANGVVLITTKRGTTGKTTFDLNLYQGAAQVARKIDLLNTEQYLLMRREALQNDGLWPLDPSLQQFVPELFKWDTTRYTDWQKKLIGGTSTITNAQLSISGGNANTQFLISGGFYREGTVFPGDFSYRKGSGRFNLSHTTSDQKFKISLSATYVAETNNLPQNDLTSEAMLLAPNAPSLFDANGNINWEDNTFNNPMAYFLKPKYKAQSSNLIANANLGYTILPGLMLKVSLGYNSLKLDEVSTSPFTSVSPIALPSFQAQARFGDGNVATWIVEPQAEYTLKHKAGTLTALIGSTFQETNQKLQSLQGRGYSSDALLENIMSAPSIIMFRSDFSLYRYNALFARINYNLKKRYILNLTGRRDGSSRFGPGKQFANFGAVGAAWIFSNEDFVKNSIPFLSFGKIRGSYGITGSDRIGDYQYLDSYSPTTYPYQGNAGLIPTRLANSEYSWESNKKLEFAIEMGLFKDRIRFATAYYHNRSSDQLIGLPLPVITGQSSIRFNLPATVQNTGWEFELSTENIQSGVFSWGTNFNLTIPRNKLVEFPNLASSTLANTFAVGRPLTVVYGFHYTGVDPQTGIYTFEDVNGDGNIASPADLKVIGQYSQQYFGGLHNQFRYKKLQFEFLIQFTKQTGRSYLEAFLNNPGDPSNQPVAVMNRWQKPGDATDIQKFSWQGSAVQQHSNAIRSDRGIVDASFARLRNVAISYELPGIWSTKIRMSHARIYIQGQNLFTLTDYKGLDPESQNSQRLPPLRVITAGVRITF